MEQTTTSSNGVSDESLTITEWSRKFGEWLDEMMVSRNYTSSELARRTAVVRDGKVITPGVTRSMISKYRRGIDRPSPRSCTRIAEVFGVNPLEVMSLAGYGGSHDDTRSRIADLIRFIPDARLPETERFLRFMAAEED